MKCKSLFFFLLIVIFSISCNKSEEKFVSKNEDVKVYVKDDVLSTKTDSQDSTDYVMSTVVAKSRLKSSLGNFTDIAVYIGNKSGGYGPTYNGMIRVDDIDLNAGAGGAYIYIYCKNATLPEDQRIVGVKISAASLPFTITPDFYNNFKLLNDTDNPLLYMANMNYGAGGKYIYGYYSYCDGSTFNYYLDGIGVIAGSSASISPTAPWKKINVDLNSGAAGKYVYLIVKQSLLKCMIFCQ